MWKLSTNKYLRDPVNHGEMPSHSLDEELQTFNKKTENDNAIPIIAIVVQLSNYTHIKTRIQFFISLKFLFSTACHISMNTA